MGEHAAPAPGSVLITGALGFVGRHLARALLDGGQTVVGVGRHLPDEPIPTVVGEFTIGGDRTGDWIL